MHLYRKCWFDPFEEQFISPFLSNCPSLMLGIAVHCIQPSQAVLERGVCELAHSFFHLIPCLLGSDRFCFYREDKPEFYTMGAYMFLKHFLFFYFLFIFFYEMQFYVYIHVFNSIELLHQWGLQTSPGRGSQSVCSQQRDRDAADHSRKERRSYHGTDPGTKERKLQ